MVAFAQPAAAVKAAAAAKAAVAKAAAATAVAEKAATKAAEATEKANAAKAAAVKAVAAMVADPQASGVVTVQFTTPKWTGATGEFPDGTTRCNIGDAPAVQGTPEAAEKGGGWNHGHQLYLDRQRATMSISGSDGTRWYRAEV
ncbi:MAG: hypothetical protein AAB817_01985, partial [Patescibacteria group bacterium]